MARNSAERSNDSSPPQPHSFWLWFAVCSVCLAIAARLIQHDLIWVEEGYGLAAAAELLRGKVLYRDIWFDKPPLYAWFYVLCGGRAGWPLRLLGSVHVVATAVAVWWTGGRLWGSAEGLLAAALCCFGLTFWIPSAVMAAAPDLLMLIPHVLAVGLAVRGASLSSGLLAGIALLCNSRGVFVMAAAALWTRRRFLLLTGFLTVQVLSLLLLPVKEYWSQVWLWGLVYSAHTFVAHPLKEALLRTAGWLWFHLTAASGTAVALARERDWRLGAWILLSLVAVAAGWRFFPRYYFHLLPVVTLAGARGILLLSSRWRIAVMALLLIPAIRFGPRYLSIASSGTINWSDAAMMEDSREVAARLRAAAAPGASLLVWGYRPDIYPFSGLPAGTRFLDSQPLTGVLADRHLTDSTVLFPDAAAANRRELARLAPEFVVDGLGLLNPNLALARMPDLQSWLTRYEEIGRTRMSVLYRLRPDRRAFVQER